MEFWPFFGNKTPGSCKKVVGGVVCGKEFLGPPNQKHCPMHSERIKITGKNPEGKVKEKE